MISTFGLVTGLRLLLSPQNGIMLKTLLLLASYNAWSIYTTIVVTELNPYFLEQMPPSALINEFLSLWHAVGEERSMYKWVYYITGMTTTHMQFSSLLLFLTVVIFA